MIGFVYILRDKETNRLYIGSTTDLKRRLYQHKSGHVSTTRRMKSLNLAFHQKFPNIGIARRIENKLKRLKRKDYLEKIIKEGVIKKLDKN